MEAATAIVRRRLGSITDLAGLVLALGALLAAAGPFLAARDVVDPGRATGPLVLVGLVLTLGATTVRRAIAQLYVLWWITLAVALTVDTNLAHPLETLLFMRPLGESPAGVVAIGGIAHLAVLAVLGRPIWRRLPDRAALVVLVVASGAALVVHLAELPGRGWLPGNVHLVAFSSWWIERHRASTTVRRRPSFDPGHWTTAVAATTAGPVAVLIARQHVERATVVDGRLVDLVGPWFPSAMWTAITVAALGIVTSCVVHVVGTWSTEGRVRPLEWRHTWIIVTAGAFLIRLVTLLTVAPVRTDGGDPLFYHSTANILANGGGFPEPLNFIAFQRWIPSALHGPLYPLVLSFGSRFGASTYFDHKFMSLLIGAGVVAVTMAVARRIAGSTVAVIAGVLAAVYPNLWIVDGVLFPEGLMALCTMLVVYFAYRWRERPLVRYAVAMGAIIGLSALTRGEGLLLAVLIVVPWLLTAKTLPWKERGRQLVLAGLACLIVLAPWAIRNARSFDDFVPLSTNGNELFVYANCDETYSGKFLGFWLFDCQEQIRREGRDATGDEAAKSLYWRRIGLDYARDNATELPRVIAARILRQWELFRPWQNTEFAPIEGRNKTAARAGLFTYYGLAVFAIAGVVTARRRGIRLLPLGALFASVTLTAAYAYGTTRFRLPAEPALCILAALGLAPTLSWLRRRYRSGDRETDLDSTSCFVHGGPLRPRRPGWRGFASLGAVITSIAIPLPALYSATGSTMEEGFMLVFPERVIRGDVANLDFLHLYGPGSLHWLSFWYRLFDVSLASERTFGLVQHCLIVFGLYTLARPWGRRMAVAVAVASTVFVLTPIGLQALAWSGGLGLLVWSIVLAVRSLHTTDGMRRNALIGSGLLAGLSLTFRPDLGLALVLVIGWLVVTRWRDRKSRLTWVASFVVGLTSLWVHLVAAGPGNVFRGIFTEPVFTLRPGRELPRPPSWDHLDGALQVIGEKFAPWWGLPSLGAAKQLFVWFFLLPLVAFGVLVVARRFAASSRRDTLTAGALIGVGILPQALQRPDSAHFNWVSCISWPIAILALYEVGRVLRPRAHLTVRRAAAMTSLALVVVLVVPFFTVRTYADLAWRSVTNDRPTLTVERDGRTFNLGDYRPWRATQEVVADLDRLARPGERLFVGPVDLRQTAYSDAFFYYLFPDLEPATYFIEMDPGLANDEGSRLADDVASADWLILTRFWSGWIEPNDSIVFGSDLPNQIVERDFCLRGSYQADVLRLYQRCDLGEGIGPYDAPYEPRVDYAVEVLVPVPPRPDGTCTPTCNGRPAPTGGGFSREEADAITAAARVGAP